MPHAIDTLRFGPDGLLPAIVQDARDGTVLMLAYMNREALERTLQTGYAHFWSRSRQALWRKGETSGHVQRVKAVYYDCDQDALLLQVEQQGVACHTGQRTCFHRALVAPAADAAPPRAHLLAALYERIVERQESGTEASYVWRLTQRGQDAICKKVVEEAAEVVLASKNGARPELVYEMADLWFHTLVLLGTHRVPPDEVLGELQRRFGKPGGGKPAAPGGVQPAEPAGS